MSPVCTKGTGLHLRIERTGIETLVEGKWKTKKRGAYYRRQWRTMMPLGIDAETLEIRAIVGGNSVEEAPMLLDLLAQIPPTATALLANGNGANGTKGLHEAIALREANAVIPVRCNAQPW